MDRSYRLGLLIVAGAVAAGTFGALFVPGPAERPAGEDLAAAPTRLGAFRLQERSGRSLTEADLADRVWIAGFIFTRCPSSCPRISAEMRRLQDRLAGTGVRLVSVSVDPEYDTPSVLSAFARRYGADPARWLFLTGPKADVFRLILEGFQLDVAETGEADRRAGAESVMHSARLALVDRGNRVIGYFDSTDPAAVARLARAAALRDRVWLRRLPAVNATLNGTSALVLLSAWLMILRRNVRAHVAGMVSALVLSGAFLTCYLVYHSYAGSTAFRGTGPARAAYFAVLLSHTALAAAVVPMIVLTVVRAARGRFADHVRIARVTLPIWAYVSITGVLVYLMLYHWPVYPPSV